MTRSSKSTFLGGLWVRKHWRRSLACLILQRHPIKNMTPLENPILPKRKVQELNFGIIIHSGGGRFQFSSRKEVSDRKKTLTESVKVAYDILRKGGSSLDAVES